MTKHILFNTYRASQNQLRTQNPTTIPSIALMASKEALCRIRVNYSSLISDDAHNTAGTELIFGQPDPADKSISTPHCGSLRALDDCLDIPLETRLQWAKAITDKFCDRAESDQHHGIRDWDLVLGLDGSVENITDNPLTSSTSTRDTQVKVYPARYRLPKPITDQLSSDSEKILRAELFALGSLLYKIISYQKSFYDQSDDEKDEEEVQSRYTKGEFPDDVWGLSMAVSILGCWCPEFAKELLGSRTSGSFLGRAGNYIKNHPILFSFQILGGITSIASLVAVPVLGAVGFAATGPVAGSAAAAWQASLGLVEAGSLFAWCQSAAMGGAAVGGIMATGLTGATVAVGAGAASALDAGGDGDPVLGLKERFLVAWRREIGEEMNG